jgi:hypothetical protein
MFMGRTGGEETTLPSSTLAVAFWLVHIHGQPDGWALFPRNHRSVALIASPPRPRLRAEVTAQQEQDEAEAEAANEPNNGISDVEHTQNINTCCANSCTFKPDGKSGATGLDSTSPAVVLETLYNPGLNRTDDFNGGTGT